MSQMSDGGSAVLQSLGEAGEEISVKIKVENEMGSDETPEEVITLLSQGDFHLI